MAIVPNDTRFIGINPTVNLRERRSARINRETQPVSMQDITDSIRPYKVYTALLTQSGEDNLRSITGGALVKGITYHVIGAGGGNEDFSNVGLPVFYDGAWFVSTADEEPINWDGAVLEYNPGAPVVTVLENTIGNIWFTYYATGEYQCTSDNLFIADKTAIDIDAYGKNGNSASLISTNTIFTTNKFSIYTYKDGRADSILTNNRIEIRVYN